ncbi:FKBP-type peptidyl-prolyl cis-trans isomerase [Amphritea balenae]|uniref:Peptidyl-prolyl cis-trans isomerase n=1 Tax=Amphritea balenae TaxID=452629 RepID=A0A3P1SS62_9GAMM|nr:FKBP-type peptidyl-prolyl cis-trans isomerase [Amphritea balenae]RRC99889.1 FKBP-type peptidyl-prolyl cis-trans isomerase [Amphritea balenae]GGK74859.1 hypothetical protein GCM10007941_26130 [Amphritea balenae]
MKFLSVVVLSLFVVILGGCGESEEQKRFHQELLDKALNDDVKKQGVKFLEENALRDGVVVTASGLQYEVISEAQGDTPRMPDKVQVSYTGWLVDGTEFESSAEHSDKPVFPVASVIKGWREALMSMAPGSHWKIYLPSELAYGARSPTPQIPANSALVFELELIQIMPEEEADK